MTHSMFSNKTLGPLLTNFLGADPYSMLWGSDLTPSPKSQILTKMNMKGVKNLKFNSKIFWKRHVFANQSFYRNT